MTASIFLEWYRTIKVAYEGNKEKKSNPGKDDKYQHECHNDKCHDCDDNMIAVTRENKQLN